MNSFFKRHLHASTWFKSLYWSKSIIYFQLPCYRRYDNMIKISLKKLSFPDIPRTQASNSVVLS